MSSITATTSKNYDDILTFSIDVIQCVCSLDLSVTIPRSEAHGIYTYEVVNKTAARPVFGTIYFNQIYKV